MKNVLARIPRFFLDVYKDYPREILQKMLNLFAICVGTSFVFIGMLVRAIWFKFDPIEAISAMYSLFVLSLSLIFIRLKKPITAGNLSICMIFYVLGNYVLRDLVSPDPKQISRINDTAVVIIFGIIITTTYVIRNTQYIFLIITSYSIYLSHYLVLIYHYFDGKFEDATLTPFIETFAILSISLFLSFTTLSLTKRPRGLIFSNIIFYKFGDDGPNVAYSEHPLEGHEESSAGAYFYTTIGQGAQYSTGLFGPIPFGMTEQGRVALIYAARTPDSGLKDPRLQCINYILIALVTTPDKISIIDRETLEKRLGKLTHSISDLCNVSVQNYASFIEQIHAI